MISVRVPVHFYPGDKVNKKAVAKAVLSAVAFAVEGGVAFAVAKQIANALADLDADALENVQELRTRIRRLEAHHGVRWSMVDECYYPLPTRADDDRPWASMDDDGLERTTIREHGQGYSTTLD
jgi:hypothetical protein